VSFAAVASSVAAAPDLGTAFEIIRDGLSDQLQTPARILEWAGTRWEVRPAVASAPAIGDFIARLNAVGDRCADFGVYEEPSGPVTSVPLPDVLAPAALLVFEGDWSSMRQPFTDGAILLALALRVVHERATKIDIADVLVDGYARMRRLSRLGSVTEVARRVVTDVAEMLDAERVSLALYRQDAGTLSIVATEGISFDSVRGVRIMPGDWVIGHVFASRRPIFVRDVKMLPSVASPATYRTSSFAAVPMLAGSQAVGVITVTDKRDNAAFSRRDELVLRTLSAAAAVAVVAARSHDEVTRLAHAATIDSLTGLLNRPGFDHRIHEEIERTRREHGSLAVLMADVDDFKTINDTRGHQVGDEVLKLFGAVIRSSLRVFDLCGRYGGDEFAVVMPNSDLENAVLCAERIRRRLAERAADDRLGGVSASIGVAVLGPGDTAAAILARADQCLYRAKADGKNLVRADAIPAAEPVAAPLQRDPSWPERPLAVLEDRRPLVNEAPSAELRYVLVVDSQSERAGLCLAAVAPFQVGFLKARDGQQAIGIIDRFGPPLLLIVDLSLPASHGFELVEHLRGRQGVRSEVIAWAPSRDLREYAGARLSRLDVHVIAGHASPATVRGAIEHALGRQAPAARPEAVKPLLSGEQVQRLIAALTYEARQIAGAAGVAVYLRPPGEPTYRATFAWESDQPVPHSTTTLPRAFHEIATSGRKVIAVDSPSAAPGRNTTDALSGVVGVPIMRGGEILGALCVFDVEPFSMSHEQVAALETLARGAVDATISAATSVVTPDQTPRRAAERSGSTILSRASDWPSGLLERVGGEFAVARELARARRDGVDLSVVLFEIAPLGDDRELDKSVQHASDALLRTIRQSDLPIRWSGREFVVVLPGLSGPGAQAVAERVRAALQASAEDRVAVAGGVAKLEGDESFGDVVSRARERARTSPTLRDAWRDSS
jgi:diguanylate cyclase (GGDEF)-like protein